MRVKQTIWVVLGVLLLAGAAAAIDLSASTINSSSTGWLVANNIDTSTITVTVLTPGSPPTPVSGAKVDFSLDAASAGMGSFTPTSVTTGADGVAQTIFQTKTKSGTATIIASIKKTGQTLDVTTTQKIDHKEAVVAYYNYSSSVPVGNTTSVTITLKDVWGNPIDSNNPSDVHDVKLVTTTSPGGEGFFDGSSYVDTIVLHPDATGTVTTTYRVSTNAGPNTFVLQPIGYISVAVPQTILGLGASHPFFISQTYPTPSILPADGAAAHYFTIDYYVTDEFGNPANTTLLFRVDDGTSSLKATNPYNGKVRAYFGPKDVIGTYTITASTPDNSSVLCTTTGLLNNCTQAVEFYSTDPVDMSVTANPQGMASLETDPYSKSIIQAKVIDAKGNPVTGELVDFSLGTPTYPGSFNATAGPSLSSSSATVSGGYATVFFTPGSFTTYNNPGYNASATGEVELIATWSHGSTTVVRNLTLVWKNYPYLSVQSSADCVGAEVGKAVNISITVSGDGAALAPKPVDAMLLMDNSGSMGDSTADMSGPNGTRKKLYYAKVAGNTFISKMNSATDQIGLVHFNSNATLDYSLSGNFANVSTTLNGLSSGGNTATRMALKAGIGDVAAHSTNARAIRAIILLTDGAYNNFGDPIARANSSYMYYNPPTLVGGDGTWNWNNFTDLTGPEQNMITYARDHNVRIYTVTLGNQTQDPKIQANYTNSSTTWQIYNTMDRLATETGGTHFHATDGGQLIDIYSTIAGQLRDTAGGQTFVNTDFGTLNINNNAKDMNGSAYISYVYYHNGTYNPFDSTYTNMSKKENDGSYTLEYQNASDDSALWPNLQFDVGTVKLNETYYLNFRVNFTKMGMITLFDPQSTNGNTITFVDSVTNTTQVEQIPPKHCNIIDKSPAGHGDANFTITQPVGPTGDFTTTWPIQWTTTYNGTTETAYEMVQYADSSTGQDFQFVPGSYVNILPNILDEPDSYIIDTSDDSVWKPGDTYCVRIWGYSPAVNTNPTSLQICRKKAGSGAGQYIKLE